MTHKIISINRLHIAVTFLQGKFHPKHPRAICFEISMFDISVELIPFAVKSMFWLSPEPIRLQEIKFSRSGCGPDCRIFVLSVTESNTIRKGEWKCVSKEAIFILC